MRRPMWPGFEATARRHETAVCPAMLTQVCVKVQHNGVDSLMKTDLATIEFISNRMLKRHPDAPDFRETWQYTT